jgi:hypothetical protein
MSSGGAGEQQVPPCAVPFGFAQGPALVGMTGLSRGIPAVACETCRAKLASNPTSRTGDRR